MSDYKFTVVVERDEDGLYVASVPLLRVATLRGKPTRRHWEISRMPSNYISKLAGPWESVSLR
jgi:hypothetical protein